MGYIFVCTLSSQQQYGIWYPHGIPLAPLNLNGEKNTTPLQWFQNRKKNMIETEAKSIPLKSGIHDASFASKSPFKFFYRVYHTRNLNQKTWTDLDGIEMHPIFFQLGWNLNGDWPIRKQNPYQHQFVNVNNNNYTCCAKMAGKEETPKCRKKTVTRTNGMIEDLIDFIEIHPIVAFEAIYEPMLTSF